jgi:hypothetical protein
MNKRWKSGRERQKFPDATESPREERNAAQDWQSTWAAADRIYDELRASGRKFSDTTELLREDRER